MSEEDIALIVKMVNTIAEGSAHYNGISELMECHFCGAIAFLSDSINHASDCLTVRARLIEGTIEAKLRETKQ